MASTSNSDLLHSVAYWMSSVEQKQSNEPFKRTHTLILEGLECLILLRTGCISHKSAVQTCDRIICICKNATMFGVDVPPGLLQQVKAWKHHSLRLMRTRTIRQLLSSPLLRFKLFLARARRPPQDTTTASGVTDST